jgi:signal transduction histidine kinase
LLQQQAQSKSIVVEFDSKLPEAIVDVDRNMIGSVLANILTNAIKFSNANSKIKIELQPAAQGNTIIQIRDYGVGMTEMQQSQLFDVSKHNSTPGTNMEGGTGLGLILCKEFMDLHKGFITVESEENVGTTISLQFPKK